MAKTRTLPDKYYDKDYETNGIHRVPLWRIAGFALNNTATNLYLMFMNYVSFYLLGFVGVGMVMASSFTMAMRIWDGVTDPFIGYMVDKTNGKFGKNRPFMVIGNIILAASSFIMFHFTHKLPEGPARFIFFVVFCCIYYLGYTCQCVVTKSAQSCMTNDPKQRPMFASFDGVFNTILFTVLAIVVANIANKYADVGNYTSTQFFHEFWMMTAIMSAIFTVIAVISIAPKDRPEFFGTGKPIKVGLKDYWDTLKNNRAIQMLVLSASTDKLGSTAKTSAVSVAMFACIAGSIKLQGSVTAVTTIPSVILTFLVISIVATRFGQKKAMVIGSIGGIICNVILSALWIVGDPTTMTSNPETGALNWGPFLITYVVFSILYAGCQGISGNIVIPMTADCADYEVPLRQVCSRSDGHPVQLCGQDDFLFRSHDRRSGVCCLRLYRPQPQRGRYCYPAAACWRCVPGIRPDHHRFDLQPDCHEVLSAEQRKDGRDPGRDCQDQGKGYGRSITPNRTTFPAGPPVHRAHPLLQ